MWVQSAKLRVCNCWGNNVIIPRGDGQPAGILSSHAAEIYHATKDSKLQLETAAGLSGSLYVFPQTVFMKLYPIKSFFYSSGGHIWHGTKVMDIAKCVSFLKASQSNSGSTFTNSKNSSDVDITMFTNIFNPPLLPLHINKAEECPAMDLSTASL